jgi:hypothetical protein
MGELIEVEPTVGSTPPWAGVTPAPGIKVKMWVRSDPNLSLSEERSARAEGTRRERYNAGRRDHTRRFVTESQKVVLLAGDGPVSMKCRLDESAPVPCLALHLSRRHRYAAFADLSSDKERLGFGTPIEITRGQTL